MGAILALALAAAVYPQLLAMVVVILTRPDPRPLLWACYLGAVSVSLGCALAVLLVFRDREAVAGSTSHRLGGSAYLAVGVIALVIAVLTASERGRALLGTSLARLRPRGRTRPGRTGSVDRLKTRATEAVSGGSVAVAVGLGMVLGIPGPFDLLAVGTMVRDGYALAGSVLLLVVFVGVKFLLIEIPIVGYVVAPDATVARVDRFAAWMREHRIELIAAVVALVGLLLIGRGITRLG